MEALNRDKLYGHEVGQRAYDFAARLARASDCIQCGQCEAACPQHIPIIENLQRAAALFE